MRQGEHHDASRGEETVWRLFDAQAASREDQAAVIDGAVTIDYQQLHARAQAIAAQLEAHGVAPGSLVGVCLGRSWRLVATLLGVLRAGCGYVPLDPAYPSERVRYMVQHSRVAAVIVEDDEAAKLCSDAPGIVRLDGMMEDRRTSVAEPSAGDLAYVIYTSGSTGQPKGVAVEHRSVVAMAGSMRRLLSDEELSGVLAAASVCFDPSVMEILGTLMLGGTVVLAENVLAMRELPAVQRVRTTIMVPSAMKALLAAGDLPTGIRCVVLGGEVLTRALVEELWSSPSAPRVVNVYGPTEATVFATAAVVDAGDGAITIGRPVPGSRAYVLGETLRPSPPGVAGELFLAGDQLARGYLHDDERTRQRFLEVAPDATIPERRIYRTGDLCRWTETGELAFLGRVDRQVKMRGYRIELDEIETVLVSMPGVDDVAATVHKGNGKSLLVAYLASRREPVTAQAARTYLADRLPKYMLPHLVMPMAEIPRLPNGKVDHRRLPRPAQGGAAPTRVEPRATLLDIVRTEVAVLIGSADPESILPEESLATLGLDSLDLNELTVRLSQTLGTSLPAATLVEQATVEQAVDVLREVMNRASIAPEDRGGAGPGVPQLEAFQDQIRSGYPPAFAVKVPAWSASDRAALVHHLKTLLARSGMDPYGKVVRTGGAERGVVADAHTGEEREAIIWTTNLYLGLNRDEDVITQASAALSRLGTGMGISAAGAGQTDLHLQFEREFADLVGKPAACLFPTGYTAGLGGIAGIVGDQDVVVLDQLCHASLVDGARLSGARVRTFRHDDAADLRRVLEAEASPYRTTLVVLESVYSMGEGTAPVRDIVGTAKEFGALVLIDEAHSFGLYGERGAGFCAAEGVTEDVDLIMTTLSKTLGSIGGVIAARHEHVALLKASARAYIFQSNIPPADIAAGLAALRRVAAGDDLRERLWDTAHYLRERFSSAGYELGTGDGLIVTPYFPDGETLRTIARGLFIRGVLTAAVTYPIVERGRGRLRLICSASHTRDDVDKTLAALIDAEAEATSRPVSNGEVRPGGTSPAAWSRVKDWTDAFIAHLNSVSGPHAAAPRLKITIGLPGQGELVLRIDEHGAGRRVDGLDDTPSCSLTLADDDAAAALCSGQVERLLDRVLAGGCVLGGQTQPFVWLIGRLSDWQRDSSGV